MFKRNHASPPMDMCNGPMLGKIIRYALPLMVSGVLQLLYNSADMAIVGRFAGKEALAAVGSTSELIALIVTLFIGLSTGSSIITARFWGARDHEGVARAVHTSIAVACVSSVILLGLGVTCSPLFLTWMGTPADVLPGASLYMRIYFAGIPFNLLFNFGSALLQATGDTKRPLYFLTLAGLINVLLNLFFVVVCHMAADGVALATVLSQAVSAVMVIYTLLRADGSLRLEPRKLRIHGPILKEMARIGLPSGMNAGMFAIANVLIQSAVNSFGSAVMAGNAAACNLEAFIWACMNAVFNADMTFTSQNMGARKPDRVKRAGRTCILLAMGVGGGLGVMLYFFGPVLLTLYNSEPHVVEMGMAHLRATAFFFFAAAGMDSFAHHLRGMGSSIFPMIVSLLGVCVFRIVWLYTAFAAHPTLETLFFCYPISWTLTMIALGIANIIMSRRVLPRLAQA